MEENERLARIDAVVSKRYPDVPLKFEDAVVARPPRYLYHETDTANRNAILMHGLLLRNSETAEIARELDDPAWEKYGSVFFSTVIHAIDLEVMMDGEMWWKVDMDVPATVLRLHELCYPLEAETTVSMVP